MATFEINGTRGTFDGSNWSIPGHPKLQNEILPAAADFYDDTRPFGDYDPDRINSKLAAVMELVGGTVIEPEPPEPDIPGHAY
jgi:hypothetical protein